MAPPDSKYLADGTEDAWTFADELWAFIGHKAIQSETRWWVLTTTTADVFVFGVFSQGERPPRYITRRR